MILKNKKIIVTGGAGFLGKYVVVKLKEHGVSDIFIPRSTDYDLRQRDVCERVVRGADIIIHLAAQIGGIGFIKERPGEIFYNNLIMGVELMEAARKASVEKFVAIGTVCEYPKLTPIPFKEENLWDGYPDETTASYGWAKKMLVVQAQAYRQQYEFNAINLLPVNLYGPGDNFNRASAHVIPALIKKVVRAEESGRKTVEVWGIGSATREFLYVADAAEGIVLATENYNGVEPVNLGTGVETSIEEVTELIMELACFKGSIIWNSSKPEGQPRRRLDVSQAKKFGFVAKTNLREGLRKTIEWYEKNKEASKGLT